MSRINTNTNSLIAQRILRQQNASLTKSLERLSTGLAISRGGDNPAGLIASERLRSEKVQLSAAIGNAERADQVANIAEGGLQEINSLLLEVQGLVSQTANDTGLSTDEKEANQFQIDQIIGTIDRIASVTSFGGVKLLNGALDFTVTSQDADVTNIELNGAKVAEGTNVDVNVIVVQSAQHAGLFVSLGGTVVDTGADLASSRLTFELAGADGTREFSFASGTAIADVIDAVNQFTTLTGVSAVIESTSAINLKSTEFGSDPFVSVEFKSVAAAQVGSVDQQNATDETALAGAPTAITALTEAARDTGQDIGAIINGATARGRGLTASVANDALDVSITLTSGATGAQGVGSLTAFTITGGGAKFNLGPTVDLGNQVRLGLPNIAARNLGSNSLGFVDDLGSGKDLTVLDSNNLAAGQKVVDKALNQVSKLRGRIGGFQSNVVQSTIRALSVSLENTTAAESAIRDTDFAKETADLTRSQILVNAATSALSLANSSPQSVLALL